MKHVLIKPLITEVSMKDAGRGVFTFVVSDESNKTEIKNTVKKLFNVDVTHVSTVTIKRKKTINTKFGRKVSKSILKKARVSLKKGQMIPAFEVTEEKEEKKKVVKKEKKAEKTEK